MKDELELKVTSNLDMKGVEENLLQEKKVTEEVVEKSLNYDALQEEEMHHWGRSFLGNFGDQLGTFFFE